MRQTKNKYHFCKKGGRWQVHYGRFESTYSLPITVADTIPKCYLKLVAYKGKI